MSEVYVGSSLANQSTYVDFECALQSPPNMERRWHCRKLTLMDITDKICDGLQPRAAQGKYHGVLLISEGLIESIPEIKRQNTSANITLNCKVSRLCTDHMHNQKEGLQCIINFCYPRCAQLQLVHID